MKYWSPERKLAPELMSELMFEDERKIFCRKGHPLAGAKSLRELADADWMTTSVTYNAARELNDFFGRHNLPMPRLVLRSQSALTLMISLANSDVLAMVPKQWAEFPFTVDAFETINIGEPTPAPPHRLDQAQRFASDAGVGISSRSRAQPFAGGDKDSHLQRQETTIRRTPQRGPPHIVAASPHIRARGTTAFSTRSWWHQPRQGRGEQ